MRILSLDPGATTGYAIYQNGLINADELTLPKSLYPHFTLSNFIRDVNPNIVTFEEFRFRQGMTGIVLTAIEMIGVIRLVAQESSINIDSISSISSSENKAFWNNEKLKAIGYYKRGVSHGMDAVRVLCVWLMKNDKNWFNEKVELLRN